MSDLNWCTYCDNAISPYSESLYCDEQCLRADALRNHPLLGYNYEEFIDFPRASPKQSTSSLTMTPPITPGDSDSDTKGAPTPPPTDSSLCSSSQASHSLSGTHCSSLDTSSVIAQSSVKLGSPQFPLSPRKQTKGCEAFYAAQVALSAPLHGCL